MTEWLLAPAQRVEIVVAFRAQPSGRFTLHDLGYGGGMMTGDAGSELMTIQTTDNALRSPIELPDRFRAQDTASAFRLPAS